ncbi:MAG: asparagine synthase (glutamine-hydrolyzing), partial [Myxococcota bacterium]
MHCGALRAVVIGEIYDDRRLRKVLEAKGHHFRSMCDSELVLHAYREWGTALFTHLHGGFAFVLVDEERRTCLFARDAMGIRPLLFAEHERRLLIASEAKALFAMGVPARWSERGLDQALGIQYPLPGDTIFAGIQGLRPGEYAEVSLDDPTRPKTRSFFQPEFEVQRAPTAPAELRQTLIAAVERRLRGEGAKCTLLSGGLDSASITAIAAASCRRNGRPPLPAYTVSFVDHRGFDEAARARAIADHLGLDRHLVIEVEDRRLADGFARAVVQGEGLVINGHITAKRDLIARIAEDGHRVVLTGEGADELFLGYAHLRADTGVDSAVLAQSNRASSAWMLPAGDNANGAATGHATWLSAKASVGHIINGFVHHPDARRPERAVVRLLVAISPPVGASPVEVNAHRWAHTALGHYILQTLGDRTEMAFAVEARFPMLDRDVVELSHRIPVTDKIRGQQEKWCLRQAMT